MDTCLSRILIQILRINYKQYVFFYEILIKIILILIKIIGIDNEYLFPNKKDNEYFAFLYCN